jgi:hypothetical protein
VTNHALKAPRQARSQNTLNKIVRAVEEGLDDQGQTGRSRAEMVVCAVVNGQWGWAPNR